VKWTGTRELKDQVTRLWDRGVVLRAGISEEKLFPKRLVLKGPSSQELGNAFTEVRRWCESLAGMRHVRFVFREVNHRVTGNNTLPREAWIDSAEDAVALLGRQKDWSCFQGIAQGTRQRHPILLPWLAQKPLIALERANEWDRMLDLIDWMLAHPRPGCYLRQVDLPGIHTKFIEAHRGLLSELLDLVLPEQAIDPSATGVSAFTARYGFRDKAERIRFRVLDPTIDPFQLSWLPDVSLDVDSLARMSIRPKHLIITENEINFLAFPNLANSWILFGAGYGFSAWSKVHWFRDCSMFYWGDIDTHGFAVLDELRAHYPAAQSFLMDRETLIAHQSLWGCENSPCTRILSRLSTSEASLFEDLQKNRFGENIRLEQERISFHVLTDFLSSWNMVMQ
jgi:hypothetical protein